MAKPRKQTEPLEPETVQGDSLPTLKRLTPADLGYKPGETVSLADLNKLMG